MLEDVYLIRHNHIWNRYLFFFLNAMNKLISVRQRKRYRLTKKTIKSTGNAYVISSTSSFVISKCHILLYVISKKNLNNRENRVCKRN